MTAVLALFLALQQPAPAAPKPATPAAPAPAPAPAAPAPAPGAPAAQRPRPAPTSSTVTVKVTDRAGLPAREVTVSAEGPTSREGVSDASGQVQLRTMSNGTYRLRASGEKFITLEKEVTVRAGATTPIEMSLSAAPPPPAPPPPPQPEPKPVPTAIVASDAKAGESRVISIADLAERSLSGRDPVKRVPVACSGLDTTEMLVVRETLNVQPNPNADVMLYVVAGEALLTMGGRDQTITSGWYAMIPRGTAHVLTKRGRNPVIVLSTVGGQPCSASGSR